MKTSIHKKDFLPDLKSLKSAMPREVEDLLSKLGYDQFFQLRRRQPTISDIEFSLYAFQIDFLKSALEVKTKLLAKQHRVAKLEALVHKIMRLHTCVSDQTREEAICELRRILISVSAQELKKHSHDTIKQIIGSIKVVMDPTIRFSKASEEIVVGYLKEAEKIIGSLGLSDTERKMIVRAMGFKQGHWFKCPNGHIYAIADCGGAMVESVCPECKATIGGGSHRLRSDNALASEMDGAARPAWGARY